jgi:hypothetical protein
MASVSNGSKTKYDVIVIGGEHNGLTSAVLSRPCGQKSPGAGAAERPPNIHDTHSHLIRYKKMR